MRRFAAANLKNFGMGKKVCEEQIVEESRHLRAVLEGFGGERPPPPGRSSSSSTDESPLCPSAGEAVDTSPPLYAAVANIIYSLVYGHRFDYQDQEFQASVEIGRRRTELLFSGSVQVRAPLPGCPPQQNRSLRTSGSVSSRCTTCFHGSSSGFQTGENSTG